MNSKKRYFIFLWNFEKYFPVIHAEQLGEIKEGLKRANKIMTDNEASIKEMDA